MNKQQFIENLKLKLKDESYEYVCQVIEYYDEMISDLIEDGKTEQEAIESLGDINDILSQMKEKGTLPDNAVMYNTIVTSDLGELVARSYGVDVEKTLTGFKFIGDKIRKYEKTGEKTFVFGYEESYG